MEIRLTDYFQARLRFRRVEEYVVRYILAESTERYFDNETFRHIVIGRTELGRKGGQLMMVAYELDGDIFTPVTIHAVTRAQIATRVERGRWNLE